MIHDAHAGDVSELVCDGRWLPRDGELRTLDEELILHEAERRAFAMVRRNMTIVRDYRPDAGLVGTRGALAPAGGRLTRAAGTATP